MCEDISLAAGMWNEFFSQLRKLTNLIYQTGIKWGMAEFLGLVIIHTIGTKDLSHWTGYKSKWPF